MHLIWSTLGVLAAAAMGLAGPLMAQTPGTKSLSRASVFLKTFGPTPTSLGLRASHDADEMLVEMAFHDIDVLQAELSAGKWSEHDGKQQMKRHEDVIREYANRRAQQALIRAGAGRASDAPLIATELGALLSIARQDGLMGHEELAQQAQAQMRQVLVSFCEKFVATCEQQNFPIEFALELQRQNLMLGTGSTYGTAQAAK